MLLITKQMLTVLRLDVDLLVHSIQFTISISFSSWTTNVYLVHLLLFIYRSKQERNEGEWRAKERIKDRKREKDRERGSH